MPTRAACRVPTTLMNLAWANAKMLLNVTHKDPIQASVEAEAKPCLTKADCMIPQE